MKIVKQTPGIETCRNELIEHLVTTLLFEAEFVDTLKVLNFAIQKKHFGLEKNILRVFNFAIW